LELSADDYGGVGEGSYQELGVVVDEVVAVQEVPEADIEPPVSFGARVRTEFMKGMAKIEGRFVIVLDAYRITDVDEIASLAASLDADDVG
jgi:purine-binding chemotaxis protein CheW